MQIAESIQAWPVVVLPKTLDREAATRLLPDFQDALGAGTLVVNGTMVERTGQAGLQLLLSARRSAAIRNAAMRFTGASSALRRAADLGGLSEQLDLPEAD